MDFLFELVAQLVFEILGELLVEVGFKGTARALSSRIGRAVFSAIAGFAFGVWWGWHLAEQGTAHRPRLLWVSVALAVVGLAAAWWRHRTTRTRPASEDVLALPWHWPDARLLAFAVLNTAIALGIVTGWTPPTALR